MCPTDMKPDIFDFFHTGGSDTFWTIGSVGIMDNICAEWRCGGVLQHGRAADIR